jgi:hypothetical protein
VRLSVLLEGANDNYVLITIQDDVDGMKSSKQTSTLEGSGAAPKWKAGEGETLIFHGLHLGKIDLLVSALVTRRAIAPHLMAAATVVRSVAVAAAAGEMFRR